MNLLDDFQELFNLKPFKYNVSSERKNQWLFRDQNIQE